MIDRVDLIITTRNRVNELLVTLNKMIGLGFHAQQIYIVDDASTDDTSAIIQRKYPYVTFWRNESPKGYIANRNFLMANTRRDFILSLDDDSHIRSAEDLEEALKILNENASYGIFTFKAYEQIEEPPFRNNLPKDVWEVKTYIGCGHIIKRKIIKELGLYNEEFEFYCEELDYSIRAYKRGYKVVTQLNLVVHHRVDLHARSRQINSELSRGIYGAVWRSKLGFSNNLIVTAIYYPFIPGVLFIIRYILKRFMEFLILKKDVRGFFGGLLRFLEFAPFIYKKRDPLSFKSFFGWIRLKSF